jgi:hypothetical protein
VVLDLEAAIERLVYTYLNPAQAGLINSIDHFRGCDTWREFMNAPADVNAVVERDVPWILATDIEPLSRENPSLREEQAAVAAIREQASTRITNKLRVMPCKWLEAFKITDPVEIERIRRRIISRVRDEEAKIARTHAPARGVDEFIVTDLYVPKKRGRKVFMYSSCRNLRSAFLEIFRVFINRCTECYELMKRGATDVPWPPECFKPPAPRLCNVI